jgi:hypothetical protein
MKFAILSAFLATSIVAPVSSSDHITDFCNLAICLNYWKKEFGGRYPVATADSVGLSKLSHRFCTNSNIFNTGNKADKACKLSRSEVVLHGANSGHITSNRIQDSIKSQLVSYGVANLRSLRSKTVCRNLIRNRNYASVSSCDEAGTGASSAWPY